MTQPKAGRSGCVSYDVNNSLNELQSTTQAYEWKISNAQSKSYSLIQGGNKKKAPTTAAKKKSNPFIDFIYKVIYKF